MTDIVIYVIIVILGIFFTKKNILPKFVLAKIGVLQSVALYILLAAMGLKIGLDKRLVLNLPILGFKSLIISIFTIIFSIIFVKIIYGGNKKWFFLHSQ